MTSEWLIVLSADGSVLAVDGGAPAEWIGARVEERADMPAEVRRVVGESRRQIVDSAASESLAWRRLTSTGQSMRVLVLHAMPVRRVATDLRALLESTISVMERQAAAIEVALTLEVAPDVPQTLSLDADKMAWTITALVGNALRFVRRGTRLMPGGAIQVRARYEPAASHVILEVQDDGRGIPQDTLSRLLERSPGQLHASGLALSLVQDVVAAHGGTAKIESSTEAHRSGTTVRLTLPCR